MTCRFSRGSFCWFPCRLSYWAFGWLPGRFPGWFPCWFSCGWTGFRISTVITTFRQYSRPIYSPSEKLWQRLFVLNIMTIVPMLSMITPAIIIAIITIMVGSRMGTRSWPTSRLIL